MAPMANSTNGPERAARRWPSRLPLLHVTLASLAALSVLLYPCADTGSASATSSRSAQLRADLAYARCMRAHGVTNFPDPNSQAEFPPFHADVSKQTSEAAQHACQHLLPHGGGTGTGKQNPQKVAFALKVAQCLRTRGYPNFPDPNSSGQFNFDSAGIDPNSPRFQATETACEKQARQELHLP